MVHQRSFGYRLALYTGLLFTISNVGLPVLGASSRIQTAQLAIQSTIDCDQEQVLALGDTIRDLLDQTRLHIAAGNVEQAFERFSWSVTAMRQLPTSEARIGSLVSILEPRSGNLPNFMEAFYQAVLQPPPDQGQQHRGQTETDNLAPSTLSSEYQENKRHLQQAITQLSTVVDSLDVSYSARKAEYWVHIAALYSTLDAVDLATQALQQAETAVITIQDDTIKANTLIKITEGYLAIGIIEPTHTLLQQTQVLAANIENGQHQQTTRAKLAIALANSGNRDQAIAVAQAMTANSYRYSTTLQQLVAIDLSQQQIDGALTLTDQIPQPSRRAESLSHIGLYHWQAGQQEQSRAVFEQAVAVAENTENRDTDLAQVLAQYVQAFPNAALPLIQTLENPDQKTDLFSQLALFYHRQGNLEQASQLTQLTLSALQEISSDWQWFTVQEKLVPEALAVAAYDQAIVYANGFQQSTGRYNREEALHDIAKFAIQSDQIKVAQQIIEDLETSHWSSRISILESLALTYLKLEQPEQALALIEQYATTEPRLALGLSNRLVQEFDNQGLTDITDNLITSGYNNIMQLSDPEEKSRALGSFLKLPISPELERTILSEFERSLHQLPDPWLRNNVLEHTAEDLIRAEQYEQATHLAQLISDEYTQDLKIGEIVEAAIATEQYDLAQTLLEQLDQPEFQTQWLLKLSDRYRQQNQINQSIQVLEQTRQIVQTIADPESRQLVFGNDGGTIIEDDTDRASRLEDIALRYAQMGQPTEARETLGLIEEATLRQHLLQKVRCWQPR